MSIKTLKYFKQSESNNHNLVALDAWQVRLSKDHDSDYPRRIDSVTFKIFGNSNHFYYSDLVKAVQQGADYIADLTGPPMPIAIRAIRNNTYVIERPPFKTSVRLTGVRAARVKKEASVLCEVWIPWTVSVLTMPTESTAYPSLKMFYNDGPLSSIDDLLITPWTPNLHHTGDICLGQTIANFTNAVAEGHIDPKNVSEVYHYLVNDYFNGGWNLDLGGGIISYICNYSIGKFTNYPLDNPDLAVRVANKKVKFRDTKQVQAREATKIKNAYLTWSLMDLPEVLEAVALYRDQDRIQSYQIRNIFENDKLEINEKESIKSLVRSIYLSGSSYVKNGPDWYITVNFSKELIIEELLKQGMITSVEEVEKFYPTYSRSICENSARSLIEDNKELFTSFIKSSLETIANNILEHSGDTQRIEFDFNQIVQIPQKEEITI